MRGRGAIRWLASGGPSALTFWMLAAWILYYVTRAVTGKEAFSSFVLSLGRSPLPQGLFVLFLLVSLGSLLRFALRRFRHSRLTAPLWCLLPLGLWLYLLGFFISAVFSQSGSIFVGLGDEVRPPWQARAYRVAAMESGFKPEILDIDTGQSPVFRFEPKVYLAGGESIHEVGAFPPTRVGNTYYHILDFGIAPGVRIYEGSRLLYEQYVIQRLLPPGRQDDFVLDSFADYRFVVSMAPKRYIVKGEKKVGVYEPDSARYNVVVQRGQEILLDTSTEGSIVLDGLDVQFMRPRYWVRLEGASNPGMGIFATGVVLCLVGLPVTLMVLFVSALRALSWPVAQGRR